MTPFDRPECRMYLQRYALRIAPLIKMDGTRLIAWIFAWSHLQARNICVEFIAILPSMSLLSSNLTRIYLLHVEQLLNNFEWIKI